MTSSSRRTGLVAAGLVLALAAGWLLGRGDGGSGEPDAQRRAAATAGGPAVRAAAARSRCDFEPAVPRAAADDGKLSLAESSRIDVGRAGANLILAGKEAAAAGRPRDAEIAFLGACRAARAAGEEGRDLLTEAKYQLGRHYASLAETAKKEQRETLLARAGPLYADALDGYLLRHGKEHEKSRFAAAGLEAVREAAGEWPPTAVAGAAGAGQRERRRDGGAEARREDAAVAREEEPAAARSDAAAAGQRDEAAVARRDEAAAAGRDESAARRDGSAAARREEAMSARQDEPAAAPAAAGRGDVPPDPRRPAPAGLDRRSAVAAATTPVRPSFDCARARSVPERLICGDPELSRLDRDLGRLHARAKDATSDPAAFRQENDREWRRREASCRDRACLLQWYAQRRAQLLETLDSAGALQQQTG